MRIVPVNGMCSRRVSHRVIHRWLSCFSMLVSSPKLSSSVLYNKLESWVSLAPFHRWRHWAFRGERTCPRSYSWEAGGSRTKVVSPRLGLLPRSWSEPLSTVSHVLLNGNPTAGYNRLLHVSSIPGENRLLSYGVQASWTRRQGHILPHFSDNDMTCGTRFGAIFVPLCKRRCVYLWLVWWHSWSSIWEQGSGNYDKSSDSTAWGFGLFGFERKPWLGFVFLTGKSLLGCSSRCLKH